MTEERKRYLKEKILNEIKNFVEDSDISLEELEDCFFELDNMISHKDDLNILKENINVK